MVADVPTRVNNNNNTYNSFLPRIVKLMLYTEWRLYNNKKKACGY